eukprot:scaffold191165_cov14-Prasinocladus_malaysianus.AAC.1
MSSNERVCHVRALRMLASALTCNLDGCGRSLRLEGCNAMQYVSFGNVDIREIIRMVAMQRALQAAICNPSARKYMKCMSNLQITKLLHQWHAVVLRENAVSVAMDVDCCGMRSY